MDFKEFFGLGKFYWFVIKINNYCNLHCENCLALCNIPIRHNSESIYRRKAEDIDTKNITLFCERLKGIGEDNLHRLSGGEPTMSPHFDEIVDILFRYNRRIEVVTNGFGVLKLKQSTLDKIYSIELDNHCINEEHIKECDTFLQNSFNGIIKVTKKCEHTDAASVVGHPATLQKKCIHWLAAATLVNDLIYPCCMLYDVELINNNGNIGNELFLNGWTVRNESLIETMANHKETIPHYAVDQCENHCFLPGRYKKPTNLITLKHNDIIKKR